MAATFPLDLEVAFGAAAPHASCCECCEGYCPLDEGTAGWVGDILYTATVDGRDYLTDRYVALRRDLLDDGLLTEQNLMAAPAGPWASVPDSVPPVSDAPQGPHVLNLCDLAGLTRHVHEQSSNVVHLYRGDEHVGWTTVATKPPFLDVADLPAVREIARKCGLDLGSAAVALRIARDVPGSSSSPSATTPDEPASRPADAKGQEPT